MARPRLLRIAAIVTAVIAVVLVVGRVTGGPPPHATSEDAADAIAPDTSATDPRDLDSAAPPPEFPRSPDGAVAAATAYGLALDGPEVFDSTHRADVLGAIAATHAVAELEDAFARGLELITTQLNLDDATVADPDFVWRVVPGGWQLREYEPSHATVAIWAAVVVMVEGRALVEPGWRTTEVSLVWEREAWRLVGFQTEPGPNPALSTDDGGEPVAHRINAFAPYHHWPHETGPGSDR